MSRPIDIVGVGMITPLGIDFAQTAASIGAGLSAFEDSPIMDRTFNPYIMGALPEDCLVPLSDKVLEFTFPTSRESRLHRLAHAAILEAIGNLGDEAKSLSLFIGLPELETTRSIQSENFLRALHIQTGESFKLAASQVVMRGRASGLLAIQKGCEAIASGSEKMVLVGGVDTFRDPYILSSLESEKRVKTPSTMDGFVPGEGAAFLLLASPEQAAAKNLKPVARISGCAEGSETGHLYSQDPYKGEGLAKTVQELFKTVGASEPVSTVYSSMNGENHFAKEWGVTFIRNSSAIKEEFRIEHPADCIGDSGAACGPIMIGLAASRLSEREIISPVLVYASSDTAARAACLVTTAI